MRSRPAHISRDTTRRHLPPRSPRRKAEARTRGPQSHALDKRFSISALGLADPREYVERQAGLDPLRTFLSLKTDTFPITINTARGGSAEFAGACMTMGGAIFFGFSAFVFFSLRKQPPSRLPPTDRAS
jgi:hypothetical protein